MPDGPVPFSGSRFHDAWATALMVLGADRGAALATERGIDALFLTRDAGGAITSRPVGALFSHHP